MGVYWRSMLQSLKHAHLALRLGLAFVFLWFGIDKFINPTYWLNAWVPPGLVSFLGTIGLSGVEFMYLNGIFEVLVGISLVSGMFLRFFAGAGLLFLAVASIVITLTTGTFSEILVRDVGLLGGLAALVLWPERHFL